METPFFFLHYCLCYGADIEFHVKSGEGEGGGRPCFRDNDT